MSSQSINKWIVANFEWTHFDSEGVSINLIWFTRRHTMQWLLLSFDMLPFVHILFSHSALIRLSGFHLSKIFVITNFLSLLFVLCGNCHVRCFNVFVHLHVDCLIELNSNVISLLYRLECLKFIVIYGAEKIPKVNTNIHW